MGAQIMVSDIFDLKNRFKNITMEEGWTACTA
jgi:hypothetical protein